MPSQSSLIGGRSEGGTGGGPKPAENGVLGVICDDCGHSCQNQPEPVACQYATVLLGITVDPYFPGGDEAAVLVTGPDEQYLVGTHIGYVEIEVQGGGVYTIEAAKPHYKPGKVSTPPLGFPGTFQCGYLALIILQPE